MKARLEIAAFNVESANIAQQYGAHRVELCRDKASGGLTPSLEDVKKVLATLTIDVYVMIRPRGGDFCYTPYEYEKMKISIQQLKALGVNGFVFGILNEDDTVDMDKNKQLVSLAHPFPCTFHRAFDRVADWQNALDGVIACGFKTILSSGMEKDAVAGIKTLKEIVQKANNRITIMPGGGLRADNVKHIREITGASFFHSSAVRDNGEIADGLEIEKILGQMME